MRRTIVERVCVDCQERPASPEHRRCYRCQEKRRLVRLNQPKNCVRCGKRFLGNRGGIACRFCSTKCKGEWKLDQRITHCANCNAPIRGRFTYRQVACSRKCGAILREKNHPRLTEKRYRYKENNSWKALSKQIQMRDDKHCIIPDCESLFPRLHTDHFFPFRLVRSWGKDPNDWNNLNTLCDSHHAEKTHIEQKLFKGDWLGFKEGIRVLHFPEERVKVVCALYGIEL